MQKVILPFLLGFLLLAASAVQAQRGLKLGAFAMPTLVTMYNATDNELLDPPAFKREVLGGMSGGLLVGWNPSRYFGIKLNVLYAQQGARFSNKNLANGLANCTYNGEKYPCTLSTTRLEYLKVPFMIGIHTNDEYAKIMWSFYGGAQLGFLTRANIYNDNTSFDPPLPPNVTDFPDAYELYETFNYSIVGETGFDIKLVDELVLNLHLRGEYSVLDAENKEASYRVTAGGRTTRVNYWQGVRGNTLEDQTRNISLGLLIGITYTLGGNQVDTRGEKPGKAGKNIETETSFP
jgi:hypothetical protein